MENKRISDEAIVKKAYVGKPIPDELDPMDIPCYIMLRDLYAQFKNKTLNKDTAESIKKVIVDFDAQKTKERLSTLRYFIMTLFETARKNEVKDTELYDNIAILLGAYFRISYDNCN